MADRRPSKQGAHQRTDDSSLPNTTHIDARSLGAHPRDRSLQPANPLFDPAQVVAFGSSSADTHHTPLQPIGQLDDPAQDVATTTPPSAETTPRHRQPLPQRRSNRLQVGTQARPHEQPEAPLPRLPTSLPSQLRPRRSMPPKQPLLVELLHSLAALVLAMVAVGLPVLFAPMLGWLELELRLGQLGLPQPHLSLLRAVDDHRGRHEPERRRR